MKNKSRHNVLHLCRFVFVTWMAMVFLCGVDASVAGTRQNEQKKAQEGLASVDVLLEKSQAVDAVQACLELLKSYADDPIYGWQIEGRLGVSLLLAQEPGRALPYLESAVQRQPREAVHHRNLGAALLLLNRRGRALSEYRVAVELAPREADLRREYGQLLLSFGDTKNAAQQLQVAWQLCGECEEMEEPLIALYLAQKKYPDAVTLLNRRYASDNSKAMRRRLVAAMSSAVDDSALVAFVGGIDESDRTADEWRLLIEAEGRRPGDKPVSAEIAGRLANSATEPLPSAIVDDHRFWGQVALNLLAQERFEAGLRAVDQALKIAPDDIVYLNNRVVLLTKLGRDKEAKAAWEQVLTLDPSLAP